MESRLYLKTSSVGENTRLEDLYFSAPYKIMSPFREEKYMELFQMSASAGIFGSDHVKLEMDIGENSFLKYRSQSYEKIFEGTGEPAKKDIMITVGKHAVLHYLPYPVIPYRNSDFISQAHICLHEECGCIYSDIFSCGRVEMGERFAMKRFFSKCRIEIGGKPGFMDYTLLVPREHDYTLMGMWGSYTHNGFLYIYKPEISVELLLKHIRESGNVENIAFGATESVRGIVVRAMGYCGEDLYDFFKKITGVLF